MSRDGQATLGLPGLEDFGLSPIRRQYLELKRRHPDAILFFRLGDFYETFEDDARQVSRALDVALTSREMGRGERLPMAGVPVQAGESYVARLIEQGFHVAIAEQVGEPTRSGIVPREVVRVMTPGTVVEDTLLPEGRHNFLASVASDGATLGLAYLDVSTGDFFATEVSGPTAPEAIAAELTRVSPAECLLEEAQREALAASLLAPGVHVTARSTDRFSAVAGSRALDRRFGAAALPAGESRAAQRAAGALLLYVLETRESAAATLRPPRLYAAGNTMLLDRATRRNLDLLDSTSSAGLSLVRVLDRTGTPMGSRLLRGRIAQPLLDVAAIEARLEAVAWLVDHPAQRSALRDALRGLPDLERLATRAGQQLLAPRECVAMAETLEHVPRVQAVLANQALPPELAGARAGLDPVDEASATVRDTLREGATVFGQGVIRPGLSDELDECRSLAGDARSWIAGLEQRERERSGVRGLKVGFNKVFGYYLEVSLAQCAQATDYYQRQLTGAETVLAHLEKLGWTRKQTLANAERFVTAELKEMEGRINRAQDEALRLERAIYASLLERLAVLAERVRDSARALAALDCYGALADAAHALGYCRPIVDEGDLLEIRGGRHAVVEQALPRGAFVPNDTALSREARVALLTGPNMAGKSTYLRQVALIVVMAQAGSFVPADSARIGVVDRVFTRIGAQDDIAAGRSTFMVEMAEAATILRGATWRSLVILDEVGRGTSTYDGRALAQAILEELHDPRRENGSPKTIFATHYHELTALSQTLDGLRNYRVEVLEEGQDVVFLHTVVPGGADRSYGVHVARLAGVPRHVTERAADVLRGLERSEADGTPIRERRDQELRACSTCGELANLEVLSLSPIEAQAVLYRLHQHARDAHRG